MYAVDYGDRARARAEYAALGAATHACVSCSTRTCAGACPHGLPVARMTEETHRLLA
jgi:hypothetical protein